MTRLRILSLSSLLMTSTFLAPSALIAQELEDDVIHLGEVVLRAINDGGAGVSPAQAANTAGSRVPVNPEDLPRAVTVLPRELFEAQGARTMEETVAYSPGIVTETYGQDNRYDEYVLRGFEAQIGGAYRDAMPLRTVDWASWRTEPFGLESVNILRGPTSDLYGTNQPGGLTNGVSKRPEFSFAGELRTVFTSEKGKEVGVDVTGPLSDTVAYRLIALVNESGTNYDAVDTGRVYIAPSLTFEPTDETRFTVYGQYQKDNVGDTYVPVPMYGSLMPNPIATYGPGTYTGNPDYNTIETTQNYLGYELEHEFTPGLTLMSRARVSKNDWLNQTEFPAAFVNLNTVNGLALTPNEIDTALMSVFDVDQQLDQTSADNALLWEFDTGAASGTLAFGLDYYKVDSDTAFSYGYRGARDLETGALLDPTLNPGLAFLGSTAPAQLDSNRAIQLDQLGLYVNGHADIGDRFVLSGGLRRDRVSYAAQGVMQVPGATIPFDHETKANTTSGNVSLGYKVSEDMLAYGSVSRSFNLPPSGLNSSFEALDIEKSTSYELGMKFTSADARTSFGVAAFDITKNDVAFDDPGSAHPLIYTQVGEVRSRGLEFEATHDFDNGLSLFGSFSVVDAKVTQDAVYGGNQTARAPRFSAALFAQYEVPQVEGLAVSFGARHTGERYSDIANAIQLEAVTLYDASISYQYEDWQMLLAARNLTDEQFIGYCGGNFLPLGGGLDTYAGSCVHGAGREVSLTLRRSF